jgi:hypothetical protein
LATTAALDEEYEALVAKVGGNASDARLVEALAAEAEWTQEGARAMIALARQYGTAVLRNALALAEALGIEDGSSGL